MTLEDITGLRRRVNKNESAGNYLQEMAFNSWQSAKNPSALSIIERITTHLETLSLSGEWNKMWLSSVEKKRGKWECSKDDYHIILLRVCAAYE